MNAPRRRPNAIGADDARSWARKIRLGNPYAKAILMALANYMNEDGTAYPGLETIAQDTDINQETVLKRERWLEDIGAIVLSKCWVDENGRRNKEGRGRPTSTEIRFLFEADIDAIEAAAQSNEPKKLRGVVKKQRDDKLASSPPDGELNSIPDQPLSPRLAPEQHTTGRGPPIEESPKQEDSPQSPPSGGSEVDEDSIAEKRTRQLAKLYPIPITNWNRTRAELGKLTETEVGQCLVGVKGYAAFLEDERRKRRHARPAKNAHIWVRGKEWIGFLIAGERAESVANAGPTSYPRESPEGRAILALGRVARYSPLVFADGMVSFRNPITPRLLAMADAPFADKVYERGMPQFGAWREFIRTTFAGCNLPDHPEIVAPWPWPPKADGTVYLPGSDPPQERVEGMLADRTGLGGNGEGVGNVDDGRAKPRINHGIPPA